MGLSAGGHPGAADSIEKVGCRPDFLVLAYPVITLREPFTHKGSRDNLPGGKSAEDLIRGLSNDEQVTARTPPTFPVPHQQG